MRCLPSVGVALATACLIIAGCKGKPKTAPICGAAAEKYTTCIAEILGPEMAAQARSGSKQGIAACSGDAKTQAMYGKCMPHSDCGEFMECLENYAAATKPHTEVAADASRKEQCQAHVKDGLRGIAMQEVSFSEDRDDTSKRSARDCLMDDKKDLDGCLSDKERAKLAGYAKQRQADCEGWDEPLAACVLRLPGAKDCDSDEFPFWREPIASGKSGPAIGWSTTVVSKSDHQPTLAWLDETTLLIGDSDGLRAVREGGELWKAEAGEVEFVVASGVVVIRTDEGAIRVRDPKSGKQTAEILAAAEIEAIAVTPDDKLIALATDGRLYRVSPATCRGNNRQCARKDGSIPAVDLPESPEIALVSAGVLILASTSYGSSWSAYDRRRVRLFTMQLGGNSNAVEVFAAAPDQHAALKEDMGVAVFHVRSCAGAGKELYLPRAAYIDRKLGYKVGGPPEDCELCRDPPKGCVASYRASIDGSNEVPVAVGGDAVAFNDHGVVIEKTHYVPAVGDGWQVKTGGHGKVAGDATNIYTVSLGQDGEGPLRVLALERGSGRTRWQTVLAKSVPKELGYTDFEIQLSDRSLAARVGATIHVLTLPGDPR